MKTRLKSLVFTMALLVLAAGCAPGHYSTHDTLARLANVRTIGIVHPDIKVYQLTEDGAALMEEESREAAKSSVEEMTAFLKEAGFKVKLIEPSLKTRKELQEVRALSKAVHKSLQEFWNPVENMAPPTLGSLEAIAERSDVEAFMFMDGLEVHKEGKAALSKKIARLAVGTIYGPTALPRQGRSRACVSLVEANGRVTWASFRDTQISLSENFREREKTRKLVRELLSRFPR